jgi:hypothetical protein
MSAKPNFDDEVLLDGDTVRVGGESPDGVGEDSFDDVEAIQVFLIQGQQVTLGVLDKLTPAWHANVPSEGFRTGPAAAFGVEIHKTNSTTITWSEAVEIKEEADR